MTEPLRLQLFFEDEHLAVPQVGDVINLKILIYPVSSEIPFDNAWIKAADFDNKIKIVSIRNAGHNANNSDAYEADVLGVITGKINPGEEIVTSIGPYSSNAQLKTSKDYQQLVEMAQSFQVVETPWSREPWVQYILYGIAPLLFLFLFIFIIKMYISRKIKQSEKIKLAQDKSDFIKLLRTAESRNEFEKIFSAQVKIHKYFEAVPQRKEFLKIIDQYQYRQMWGDPELNKVKEYRDQLIKEFDRGI